VPIGTISGTVTATAGGAPLANVAITSTVGSLSTTTASDGTFSLKGVPVGAYALVFKLTGYNDKSVADVGVVNGNTTNVAVTMDANSAASFGPTIVVTDNVSAGFNQPVTLTAQVTASSVEDAGGLTYAWTQTGGRPATLSGANTNALGFTTLKISDAKPKLVGRFGPIGFNPDESGNYAFTLTVTDAQGRTASATAHVRATWQTPGLANVATGLRAWFQGDANNAAGARTAWSWALDTSQVSGSTATLIDPATNQTCASPCNTQFPSFVPDRMGTYVLKETDSSTTPATVKTLNVYSGTWLGVMDSSTSQQPTCKGCHNDQIAPDVFTPWKNTAHYSALARKIDGQATSHFNGTCMECHTVGDSPAANNGGWDDVAKQVGWSFPSSVVPGNWTNLVNNFPSLAQLGSIQCESCHGPQNGGAHPLQKDARISFSSDVCASCHQENPTHYKPGQWATSMHAGIQAQATVEGRATAAGGSADVASGAQHCARCHSGQGYARFADQLTAPNPAFGRYDFLTQDGQQLNATNAPTVAWLQSIGLTAAQIQPQTCTACHDPHSNPNPVMSIDCSLQVNNGSPACAQLRVYDSIAGLPNGLTGITGVGAGAICMTCHNSRNGEHSDFGPTDPNKLGPPYAETPHDGTVTDVIFGFNAYFMPRYNPSPHMAVKDTCAGCHYAIPNATEVSAHQTANHSFVADLTSCATCHGSSGVDGAALLAQVKGELSALDAAIDQHVKSVLLAQTGSLTVQVSGVTCTPVDKVKVSCASSVVPSQIPPLNPPSTITVPMSAIQAATIVRNGTTLSVTFATGTTVSVPYFDPRYPANYPASPLGTATLGKISVAIRGIMNGSTYLFPPSSISAKAIWNAQLLKNDGASPIHNLPFVNAVIGNTNAQLAQNPSTP
jgi:hypothetical protein